MIKTRYTEGTVKGFTQSSDLEFKELFEIPIKSLNSDNPILVKSSTLVTNTKLITINTDNLTQEIILNLSNPNLFFDITLKNQEFETTYKKVSFKYSDASSISGEVYSKYQ